MNWVEKIYSWTWYHFEFWLDRYARRPFTYIFRDFLHKHVIAGWIIRLALIAGVLLLCRWNWRLGGPVGILYGLILGHLDWGTAYKPGEQENPEYVE
jgi:hypothetical protein